jgi:hypothetical protein
MLPSGTVKPTLSVTLKLEAEGSFRTSVRIHQTKRRHLEIHVCEKLRPHSLHWFDVQKNRGGGGGEGINVSPISSTV